MEFKLRLMELNWQKSQCVKIVAADGRTKIEVRVWNLPLFIVFCCDPYLFKDQACIVCLVSLVFQYNGPNFTLFCMLS